MKIRNLKMKVMGPILLLIPVACMDFGDGHHAGGHHASTLRPSYQHPTYQWITSSATENVATRKNNSVAQEGTDPPPEGEKGG